MEFALQSVERRPIRPNLAADFDPLPFDAAAGRALGRVAASLRKAGRKPAARAFDAMIAATAGNDGLAAVAAAVTREAV
jgi:tRNA(fMet)-specific endonuclease VapC